MSRYRPLVPVGPARVAEIMARPVRASAGTRANGLNLETWSTDVTVGDVAEWAVNDQLGTASAWWDRPVTASDVPGGEVKARNITVEGWRDLHYNSADLARTIARGVVRAVVLCWVRLPGPNSVGSVRVVGWLPPSVIEARGERCRGHSGYVEVEWQTMIPGLPGRKVFGL